jgi:hypothetical protein
MDGKIKIKRQCEGSATKCPCAIPPKHVEGHRTRVSLSLRNSFLIYSAVFGSRNR